jgi:hypothetical protein
MRRFADRIDVTDAAGIGIWCRHQDLVRESAFFFRSATPFITFT